MLNKLKTIREEHEDGFTLIELLVVILIIGILAAIAIPVFLNQRKTANDGAVESDVKNAATQVETWIVSQKGKNTDILSMSTADLNVLKAGIKTSAGVKLAITGTANGYCIVGAHENGKNYLVDTANPNPRLQSGAGPNLNYNSATGGLGKPCTTAPGSWNFVA